MNTITLVFLNFDILSLSNEIFANYWILALFDNVKLAKMSFYSLEISKSKNTSDLVFTIWRDSYVENVIGYI